MLKSLRESPSIKGFTLIEVILVIIILGILASYMFPTYEKTILKEREKEAMVHLMAMHSANENYRYQSKDDAYWSASTTNLDLIKDNLGIDVKESDLLFNYVIDPSDDQKYSITATFRPGTARTFRVKIDESKLSDNTGANPCCDNGTCPSLGGC